jgi:hypothetical protein
MDSSPSSRCDEIASDLFVIFVTAAQLIFFAYFHEYIAWYTTGPDGSVSVCPKTVYWQQNQPI